MMRSRSTFFITLAAFVLAVEALAGGPGLVNYQGILTDSEGIPISGTQDLTFAIYPDSSGQDALWSELHSQVEITDGLFNVILGVDTPLAGAHFSTEERWLGIRVGNDPEISPRMRMTSVPWALQATVADSALVSGTGTADGDWIVNDNDMYSGVAGNVGIGTLTPQKKLEIVGGTFAIRALDGSDQWMEFRNSPAYGGIINSRTPESEKKPLLIGAIHDASGSPSGETYIRFAVGDVANPVYPMMIKESGDIGIGTLDPSRDVEIADSEQARLRLTSGGSYYASTLELKGLDVGESSRFGFIDFLDQDDIVAGRISCTKSSDPPVSKHIVIDPGGGEFVYFKENGSVGIGTAFPTEKLHVNGAVRCDVLKITGGSDLAEPFDVTERETLEPGMVVTIDPRNPGRLKIADRAYDRCVAGVVSGAGGVDAGLVMGPATTGWDGKYPVALTGRVYVYASTSNGEILPGDLLTTSDVCGHAMKATDRERSQGAVIGKAMSELRKGRGLVLVLVTLQ